MGKKEEARRGKKVIAILLYSSWDHLILNKIAFHPQ